MNASAGALAGGSDEGREGQVRETADELARGEPPTLPGEPDFRLAFEASPGPMLLIAVDPPRFTMLAANRAHASAFRTTPEALVGRGVFEVFPNPPDRAAQAFMQAIRESFARTLATRRPDHMAVQRVQVPGPDDAVEERHVTAIHTPILGPDGEVAQILSSIREITAEVKERQATEARALLMREVDHRARNALTVVQSVVRLTDSPDVGRFRQVVLGRVEALARAQTSLARRKWEGAHLREVVQAELEALAFPGAYSIAGPATLLRPERVQAMSMVLHELATNAAKYGALSVVTGVVSVRWRRTPQGLVLVWREDGGPPPQPPKRSGFGSRLVSQLARQLGGHVRHNWRPDGLSVTLTASL